MADPTDPVDIPETGPADVTAAAPSSRIGPRDGAEPEPLGGTDAMASAPGGLAGTSR